MSKRTEGLKERLYYKSTMAKKFEGKDGSTDVTHIIPEYRKKIGICIERARYLTESYKATEGEPMVIRRAKALRHVFENMTIYISDGELIIGNFASAPNKLPLYPEIIHTWIDRAMEGGFKEMLSDAERKEYYEISEYWNGKSLEDRILAALPENLKDYANNYSGVSFNWVGFSRAPNALDLEILLKLGLNGLIAKTEKRLTSLNADMGTLDANDYVEQKDALNAMLIADKAAIALSKRYADLARRMAGEEKDKKRKGELKKLGEVCDWVPANPPRTLHEAIQSCFFVFNLAQTIEIQGQGIGARFDVLLNSYYRNDKEEGRITRDEAQELIECLMIKYNEKGHLNVPEMAGLYAGVSDVKDINIGGVTPEGDDATNEFSFIILDATKSLKIPEPTIALRYHPRISPELIDKAIDVIRTGIGYPAIFNDSAVIPFLVNRGIPIEDARDWVVTACVTPIIQGKNMRVNRPNFGAINLTGCLELALYQGVYKLIGEKIGADTSDPATFTCIEDMIDAYLAQVRFIGDKMTRIDSIAEIFYKKYLQRPFTSTLLEGCIEKGKDCVTWTYHDYPNCLFTGSTNVVDSMAVIKKLVFDDKIISMKELTEIVKNNWEGHEELRQRAINKVPKFGNDDDYVDSLARIVHIRSVEEFGKTKHYCGANPILDGSIGGGYFAMSKGCGATPDGRKDWSPTSDAVLSPMAGRDRNGPTAVLKSTSKITPTYAHLFNQKFMPQFLEGENKKLFAQYLKTWAELGHWHIQFNVVDKDTLLDAQQHPTDHSQLVVRVAGYSSYFVDLSREVQNDIVDRCEQRM